MKMNRLPEFTRPVALASLAIAALAFTGAAHAQFKAAGDDGIAASPRVRQALNERRASAAPAAVAAPAMACPNCADVTVVEPNRQAKGAEVLAGTATKTITRHACAACDTRLTVVGEGKARHTVASHRCTADVPNNATCCASN